MRNGFVDAGSACVRALFVFVAVATGLACGAADDPGERVGKRIAGVHGDTARPWPPGTTPLSPFSAVGLVNITYTGCQNKSTT